MKVNIYETIEISDAQRVELARSIDGPDAKKKRQATRDEIKEFVWDHGQRWDTVLANIGETAPDLVELQPPDEEDMVLDGMDLI